MPTTSEERLNKLLAPRPPVIRQDGPQDRLAALLPRKAAAPGNGVENPVASETADVPHGIKHYRQSPRRQYLNAIQFENAVKHIARLPEPGETLHMICNAKYKGFDVLPAMLKLAEPDVCEDVIITTLSYSMDNAGELLKIIDASKLPRCSFLCSVYFQKSDAPIFNALLDGFRERGPGFRLRAVRNHTKLILLRTKGGHSYVVESSSNLRSCYTLEQVAIANDAGLYDFHAGWILPLFR